MRRSQLRRLADTVGVVLVVLGLAASVSSQPSDDELDVRAGLVGEYTGAGGAKFQRVDAEISFHWEKQPPDPRLNDGKFTARWHGMLFVAAAGKHEIQMHLAGRATFKLDGKVHLDAARDKPDWVAAKPITLEFGMHAIEVEFERTVPDARIGLYWSGPQFTLEPVSSRWLFHDPEAAPKSRFERGRLLSWALRCAACHEVPGEKKALAAPALDNLAGNLSGSWLVARLSQSHDPAKPETPQHRRMPYYNLARDDATAVAAFLLQGRGNKNAKPNPPNAKDVDAGQKLFHTLGCLACHSLNEIGQGGLFGGGDLSHIADKRPADYFVRWLEQPDAINRHRRMPVFELSAAERRQLAAYLATLKPDRPPPAPPARDAKLIARGQHLVIQHHCAACHALPQPVAAPEQPVARRLTGAADWRKSCLDRPDGSRPGYQLPADDQAALREYVAALDPVNRPPASAITGAVVLTERNCLNCHARGLAAGLASHLPQVIKAHPPLAPQTPAMTPPSLNSVGDKMHDEALRAVIQRTSTGYRPWLMVRMPRFNLSDEELAALVKHLIEKDRIPPQPDRKPPAADDRLKPAGGRLVTSDGFGCTSCHAVGKVEAPSGPVATRGPQLLLLDQRIRREWYERWVRNPARIVPRMEMPSVQIPVAGVLDGNLDRQLTAVWTVLNDASFVPPRPNPIRIARQSGMPGQGERAIVITEVIHYQDRKFIKPLLVGLPHRHNILFDLETNRLAAWWLGDAARLYAPGKSWVWEATGPNLLTAGPGISDLSLVMAGQVLLPQLAGQFPTEIDAWEHVPDGLLFKHRLHFESAGVLPVTQLFTALRADGKNAPSGFRRRISIEAPANASIRLLLAADPARAKVENGGRSLRLPDGVSIHVRAPGAARITDGVVTVPVVAGKAEVAVDYRAEHAPESFEIKPLETKPLAARKLDVAPGYEAMRLPLTSEIMPSALAWRPDGTLIVASLKGRVWLARDSNGDGIEDTAAPFSDDLAAPYGLAARDNYIDVLNKYALLRLFDDNGDGRADRTVLLASGWGHTADYHDWAVGLPRDDDGNYYASFACQQDKRSPAAAVLRGRTVKLVPREATRDDPRTFAIEVLSEGHRFGTGIARNRAGDLVVTDNQGNWNPYNELNHVVKGAFFGFRNALEREIDRPITDPAIAIPHPWTRSVNGIAFLETPEPLRKRGKHFGPFEGHLIGCEYDTRRLVRMSLQRVGATMQGAVYPFTTGDAQGLDGLLGPVVCAVSPGGDLYVGNLRDSGWGGGNNVGDIVRFRPAGDLPPGIAEVRADAIGFIIDFTAAVDPQLAADPASYAVASARRIATSAYGGKDVDSRTEKFTVKVLSPRRVQLRINDKLREGFLYEFHVKNLAGADRPFFPAEAYYTLRKTP